MATVSFAPDRPTTPLDAKLEELGAQALLASRPIRLRLQPDLYDSDRRAYQSWTGLTWTLDISEIAEGRLFREGLGDFMQLFGDDAKQAQLLQLLRDLRG